MTYAVRSLAALGAAAAVVVAGGAAASAATPPAADQAPAKAGRLAADVASGAGSASTGASAATRASRPVPTSGPAPTSGAASAARCSAYLGSVQNLPALYYGNRFVAAVAGDRPWIAKCYGLTPVASLLFAQAQPVGTTWTWVAGDAGWGYFHALYASPDGAQLLVTTLLGDREPGGGWHAVQSVRLAGTSGPVTAYGNAVIDAWKRADGSTLQTLVTPGALRALVAHWPGPTLGAATLESLNGVNQIVYTGNDGSVLRLRVNATAAARGDARAVTEVAFG